MTTLCRSSNKILLPGVRYHLPQLANVAGLPSLARGMMEPGVELSDIVALPTRREYGLIARATRLFGRKVHLYSYHNYDEERLDLWFRRDARGYEEFGLRGEEAVSIFRNDKRRSGDLTFGPWVQILNLGYEYFPVTVVHELSHLVDRYHRKPLTEWSSISQLFLPLYEAYTQTYSYQALQRIRLGRFPTLIAPDGSEHQAFDGDRVLRTELKEVAFEMLKGHEVFARCLTAYVFYEQEAETDVGQNDLSLIHMFQRCVEDLRNRSFGANLNRRDFHIIQKPMQDLLDKLGWNRHE